MNTRVDKSNFPTLAVKGPISAQQIVTFLQEAGLEVKASQPNGLGKQFRLELAASYLNTFLLVEGKKI